MNVSTIKSILDKIQFGLNIANKSIPVAQEIVAAAEAPDNMLADAHKLAAIKLAEEAIPGDSPFEPLIVGAAVAAILYGIKKGFTKGSAS